MPYDTIAEVSKLLNRNFQIDEVESLLLTLLDQVFNFFKFQGIVRGYMMHSRKIVVFSKSSHSNAFPPLYNLSVSKRG